MEARNESKRQPAEAVYSVYGQSAYAGNIQIGGVCVDNVTDAPYPSANTLSHICAFQTLQDVK